MSFHDLLRWVFKHIKRNFFESLLVILGISFGVIVICSIIGLFMGIDDQNQDYITSMVFRTFTIRPIYNIDLGELVNPLEEIDHSLPERIQLTLQDYLELNDSISGLDFTTFWSCHKIFTNEKPYSLRFNKLIQQSDVFVFWGNSKIPDFFGLSIIRGVFFNEQNLIDWNKVIVLSNGVAEKYFAEQNPIGKKFDLGGKRYTVIGIVDTTDVDISSLVTEIPNLNEFVFVPWTSFFNTDQLFSLDVIADKNTDLFTFHKQVKQYLKEKYGGKVGISAPAFRLSDFRRSVYFFIKAAGIFSCTVLLVAAINLMNLMMARVLRRSKSFGLAKALGANRKELIKLVLLETTILSLLGGLIGVPLFLVGTNSINNTLEIPLSSTPLVWVSGFASIVLISIIFGLYPAIQAAQINPVDTLKADQ